MFSNVPRHGLNCEPLLIGRFRVTLHLFQRQMTGPSRDFVRAATRVGLPRATGRAESVECAAPRESRFVAPCPELPAELGRPVRLAGIFGQEREVSARCRVDDCQQFRNLKDRQRQLGAGFLLLHVKPAVVDVLPPHADHVAKPLHRVETKRESQPSLRANRVRGLELRDLGISPIGSLSIISTETAN